MSDAIVGPGTDEQAQIMIGYLYPIFDASVKRALAGK
jgi:hypothetical protein